MHAATKDHNTTAICMGMRIQLLPPSSGSSISETAGAPRPRGYPQHIHRPARPWILSPGKHLLQSNSQAEKNPPGTSRRAEVRVVRVAV